MSGSGDLALVTGAAGFLGSAVARARASHGLKVRAMVRASSPRENLQGLDEVVEGYMRDGYTNPAATVRRFNSDCFQGDFYAAAQALDLSRLPVEQRTERGPILAQQLMYVIQRRGWVFAQAIGYPLAPVDDLYSLYSEPQTRGQAADWDFEARWLVVDPYLGAAPGAAASALGAAGFSAAYSAPQTAPQLQRRVRAPRTSLRI